MSPKHLIAQAHIDTPLGPLLAAATAQGLAGLWFDDETHHPGPLDAPVDDKQAFITMAREQLANYWRNPATTRFELPLDAQGTPFQQAVWRELLQIPRGGTCSYSDIAQRVAAPSAVRAVGAAIGRNPVSIIIPCHRVVGRNGSLTGYAGGLARKQALLEREGARVQFSLPA